MHEAVVISIKKSIEHCLFLDNVHLHRQLLFIGENTIIGKTLIRDWMILLSHRFYENNSSTVDEKEISAKIGETICKG